MSSNSLNDLSKVYLDRVATLNTDLSNKDIKRWENLGGPTPEDYKPTGDSAKIKSESKKVRVKEKQGFSDWRSEGFFEAITTPITDKKDLKKIKEVSGINNKVAINPRLKEAVAEMGGELLEVADTAEKEAAEDPGLKSKEQRQKMIKKQVLLKKLQAVRAGSHQDITASYEPEIEGAVEFFYEEGINEEGLDLIIEEIGLDDFVDFVIDDSAELLNEERAARRATVRAKKYDVVKKEVDKADAARRASKKGEYAPSYAKKETDVTVYDDKPAAKKKVPAKKPAAPAKPAAPKKPAAPAKPVAPKKPVAKKVVKAIAKVKPTQPKKVASKTGLRDKIRTAVKAGVKRHKKAVQPARVFAKGFKRGVTDTVKFAQKAKKAVVGEATDAELKAQEKAVFELEKKEANTNRAKAKKARAKEIGEGKSPEQSGIVTPEERERRRKKNTKIWEAKVDTGKSADEKAKERNLRNTPPGADKDTDLKTFITRKPGESLEKARQRVRQRQHAARRGVSEAVKGQETAIRKAMSAERKTGDKRLSPSEGKRNADKMERDVKFFDKLTKKAKHTPGSIDESATNPKKFSMKKFARGLEKQYGKGSVISKYTEKPKPQPQKKREPKKDTRSSEQKKKDQEQANIDAQYGGRANRLAGRGLGT